MNGIIMTLASIHSRKVKNNSKFYQNTEHEMALIFFCLIDLLSTILNNRTKELMQNQAKCFVVGKFLIRSRYC